MAHEEIDSSVVRILVVADGRWLHEQLEQHLSTADTRLEHVERAPEAACLVAAAHAEQRSFAVAFVGASDTGALELPEHLRAIDPDLQIVLCSEGSAESIAPRLGGDDRCVILKQPFEPIEARQLARSLAAKNARARRTRDLERLEALGRLASGISHEINNPLAFLLAHLALLAEGLEQLANAGPFGLHDRLRADVEKARIGADRIQRIVKDLNFLLRSPEADRVVDVEKVVGRAIEAAVIATPGRARIVRAVEGHPSVRCSAGCLEQVVANLIINAAQAMPPGEVGTISVTVLQPSTELAQIVVRDTGCGMTEKVLAQAFEPFFSTKTPSEGTGLGLAVCNSIVTAMGGQIFLTSQPGQGTTVTVTLPAVAGVGAAADAAAEAPAPVPSVEQDRVRVLLADDEQLLARALARQLRAHQIVVSHSGLEAVELCRTGEFDVIVCDLMMRDLSGPEIFDQVTATHPQLAHRFIFITGGAVTPLAKRFVERVKARCLHKPFPPSDLDVLIRLVGAPS